MQVTTLNRIIGQFMVGALALVIALLATYGIQGEPSTFDFPVSLSSAEVVVFAFPIALFLGVLIDGISDVFRPNSSLLFLPKEEELRPLAEKALFVGREAKGLRKMRKLYRDQLKKSEPTKSALEHERDLAVGVLFKTANPQTIGWVEKHYSLSLLALSYSCVSLLSVIVPFLIDSCPNWLAVPIFAITYFFVRFAVKQYLYTYRVVYRHAILEVTPEIAIHE